MASLNVRCALTYHDAPRGTALASKSVVAHTVIKEYKPRSAGVVRRMARSDHWRWVSTPRWARHSAKVTSTCHQHRIELGIGAEEGLRLTFAGRIADQDPAQRDRRRAGAIPDGNVRSD